MSVHFGAAAAGLLIGADNAGERTLLQQFLPSFLEMIESSSDQQRNVPANEVDRVVDTHAPLGLKKKLMLLRSDLNVRLVEGDLDPYRPMQEPEKQLILDDLGLHLTRQEWWKPGEAITADQRTKVLNDFVIPYLFSRMKEIASSLESRGTIEWFVAFNERLVYEEAQRRFDHNGTAHRQTEHDQHRRNHIRNDVSKQDTKR